MNRLTTHRLGAGIGAPLALVVAVLVTVLVTIVTTAAPASARRVAWSDPTGDMWVEDTNGGGTTTAPDATVGDVRRVVLRYTDHALWIRVRFVDLRRTGSSLGFKGDLRTSAGGSRYFSAFGSPGEWRGATELGGAGGARCRMTVQFDYALNRIALRIPASCLHRPRWVQVTFASLHAFYGRHKVYEDNALGDRPADEVWSKRVRRG